MKRNHIDDRNYPPRNRRRRPRMSETREALCLLGKTIRTFDGVLEQMLPSEEYHKIRNTVHYRLMEELKAEK